MSDPRDAASLFMGLPVVVTDVVPRGEYWLVRPPERVLVSKGDLSALVELRPGTLVCRVFDLDQEVQRD